MESPPFDAQPSWEDQQDQSSSSHGPPPPSQLAASSQSGLKSIDDSIYFHCMISEPVKESEGQNAYITYLVTTETNSTSFLRPNVQVRRRFSDFVYLFDSLTNEFPASAVPPLPDRSRLEYLKGDRFGPEFTSKRAASLTRFLTRIGLHPYLKKSRVFHTFLESEDWNTFKKHNGGSRLSVGSTGSGSQLPGSGNGAASSVIDGISDTILNAFAKVNNPSQELIEVKDHADKLDENLAGIEKTFGRVARRQGDLVHDLDEFGVQMMKLAQLEPTLNLAFSEFAKGVQGLSKGYYTLKDQVESDYISSLRDMEAYLAALKGLIKQREQKQLDYEALSDYLSRAKSDRDILLAGGGSNFLRNKVEDLRGVSHEVSRRERLAKLEAKIDELNREIDNAHKTSDAFEEFALNEVKIFDDIKHREMKDTLSSLTDYNIQFYQSVIQDWENIGRALED